MHFRVLIFKCVALSRCNYPSYWNRAERHSCSYTLSVKLMSFNCDGVRIRHEKDV